jgi:hypothetical protein
MALNLNFKDLFHHEEHEGARRRANANADVGAARKTQET